MFQKTSWVHRIWPSIAVGRRPRNSQVKRLSGFRPRVESLEDRCVMTLVAGMDGPLAVVADMPVCIDVLANDSTDNSQGLSIVDFTQGTNGYVSLNPDNTLSYVPFPGSNAPDAFNYTVTDGDDTTTATVYVNTPTAGESSYYAIYQAAVMQADQGFYSAVYAAASTAQASIESALTTAQSGEAQQSSTYSSAVSLAQQTANSAVSSAEAAYQSAVQSADSAEQSALTAAGSVRDAALSAAQSDHDQAMMNAYMTNYSAWMANEAAYEAAIAPFEEALQQAYMYLMMNPEDPEALAAVAQAQANLNDATATAAAQRDAANAAATAVMNASMDAAAIALADAQSAAWAAYDAAAQAAADVWGAAENAAYNTYFSAVLAAQSALSSAEQAAWSVYTTAVAALEAARLAAEDAALALFDAAVSAAQAAWAAIEQAAWNAYLAGLAGIGNPPPGVRLQESPPLVIVPYRLSGLQFREREMMLELGMLPRPPRVAPLLDWARAVEGAAHFQAGFRAGHYWSVPVRGGGNIDVWRPDNGVADTTGYWCHGFAFGGSAAPGGPFSIYGNDVDLLLDRGYGGAAAGVIAQRDARVGDIIVWRDGAQVDHTAVITAVVLDGNNLDLDLTTLNSKNGNRAFEPNKTLRAINTDDYPGDAWTIYRAR